MVLQIYDISILQAKYRENKRKNLGTYSTIVPIYSTLKLRDL